MKIGFTGTRIGLTKKQEEALTNLLMNNRLGTELHHGCCSGADNRANSIARSLSIRTIGHPPTDRKALSSCMVDEMREEAPYLERNRHIVDECSVLIGTPKEFKEVVRSGTWYTIRYARKSKKFTCVIYPNGGVEIVNKLALEKDAFVV